MRETPPYSLVEIRLIISQALAGALEAEQMFDLDALMMQYPEYHQEFLKMQAAQALVRESLEQQTDATLPAEPEPGALWQTIASQLEQDNQTTPEDFPAEWISAYVDGEIPRDDQERLIFEGQLSQNPKANALLSGLGQISETVRQFGYRLENACAADFTEQVMAAFQAEQAEDANLSALNEEQPLDAEWELLSAFSDQALSPRETIAASQLIESSELARANLYKLNRLSEQIQQTSQQAQSLAPDLWPDIRAALQASPAEQVVALRPSQTKQWLLKAAIPIAATLPLGLFSLPSLHLNSFTPQLNETVSKPATRTKALPAAEAQPTQSREIASLPVSSRSVPQAVFSPEAEASEMAPVMDKMTAQRESAPAASLVPSAKLKPMLEPAPAPVVAEGFPKASAMATPTADADASPRSPSSEAYLFDSLSRQSTEEDISNILGK